MTETVKETTVTTAVDSATTPAVAKKVPPYQMIGNVIYFLFGILEVLLVFRLVFKLTGASLSSGFVSFIYNITSLFIMPFEGIFRRGYTQGVETTSVLEPSTLVAIVVYAVVAWGIAKLPQVLSNDR